MTTDEGDEIVQQIDCGACHKSIEHVDIKEEDGDLAFYHRECGVKICPPAYVMVRWSDE